MWICLFEDEHVSGLRPLVESRAAYDLRLGGRTIAETVRDVFAPDALCLHARPLVAGVTARRHESPVNAMPDGSDVLFVNGRFVADGGQAQDQLQRAPQQDEARAFMQDDTLVGAWMPDASASLPGDLFDRSALTADAFADLPTTAFDDATLVGRPWHLLDTLRAALVRDIAAHTETPPTGSLADRPHAAVHESVTSVHDARIHVGEGATIRPGALLNADEGPICVGPNAVIHERAVVRGPCYIGPKTHVKTGADVENAATGTWCKIGGEVHDSILQGFSNKSHPGFLGHAVLGCWCNLGADTNASNLRNDYGEVSAYAPDEERFVDTGRQFAGLFMGDHSKCGINTMLNTGTVIGTNCNLYGGDFPPRYVPPFSWGGAAGLTEYRLGKACTVAEHVMARRDTAFTKADRTLLETLFEQTRTERTAHHG